MASVLLNGALATQKTCQMNDRRSRKNDEQNGCLSGNKKATVANGNV
jgi:hypothetical protein